MKIFLTLFVLFLSILLISSKSYSLFHGITSIESATCEDIEEEAKGTVLQNVFGAEFEILQVKNSIETHRSDNKLVCIGDTKLSNGEESKLRMELYEEDGQLWYIFKQELNSEITHQENNKIVSKSTLKENILNCKKISNNNDRLLCFDEMSVDIKTADAVIIPSIEKLFLENVLQIGGLGKPFYGCLIDIKYSEEQRDALTNEIVVPSSISEVSIGNVNNYLSAYIEDFALFSKDNENAPQIADCFAFLLDYPISNQPYWGWANGWGKIYQGNDYVVDEEVKIKKLGSEIDVEKYFKDNVSYGSKKIQLTGQVSNINSISSFGLNAENINFELSSPNINNDINKSYAVYAFFKTEIWQNNESLKNRIKSIQIGDTITVDGFFVKDFIGATHAFNILEIISDEEEVQKEQIDKLEEDNNVNDESKLINNFPLVINLKGQLYLDGCGYPKAKYTFKENYNFELIWICSENSDETPFKGNWKNISNNENSFERISTTYLYNGNEYTDIIFLGESFVEISWGGGEPQVYDYLE